MKNRDMEKAKERKTYASDLTEEQWEEIAPPIYRNAKSGMEQERTDERSTVFS